MASSSGNSSGTLLRNSSSEEDLQRPGAAEERKRKRMESNRESARRSRMRKQKLMDDLMIQAADLRAKNTLILTSIGVATHHLLNVEADNSVLRAQTAELSHRLHSLTEILGFISAGPEMMGPTSAPTFQMPIMASHYHDFGY